VRPGLILSILTPLLIAAGAACFVAATMHGSFLTRFPNPEITSSILLLVASGCGLLWIAIVRRQCREFARVIQTMTQGDKLQPVDCNNPVMKQLTSAMNGMVEMAQHTLDHAARQMKEMEIQLKVITAERQDAQAILHSISDAVIVTDPFDDVIMANEA
jgi:methyl-accepting chemotaxis protein